MRVTVVIPAYNRGHLIQRALTSALRETRMGDEIIVVDDGSTDNTRDVVARIADPRLRYIWQPNQGAGAARNRGAAEATGELICFLDSDDTWLPGKLELQRNFMEAAPEVLYCFTDFIREFNGVRHERSIRTWHCDVRSWCEICGQPSRRFSSFAPLPGAMQDFNVFVGDYYHGEMHTNYILTSCLMVRRREAGAALHFAEGVSTFEDWECFGRIAGRGPGAFLDCETAIQFSHPGPRLTDAGLIDCAKSRLVVLKRVWGSDPQFLAKYRNEYEELVTRQKYNIIRGLLVLGETVRARDEIRALRRVPLTYRILSQLPGGVLRSLLHARRMLLARSSRFDTRTGVHFRHSRAVGA